MMNKLSRLCNHRNGMQGLHAVKTMATVAPISKQTTNLVIGISVLAVMGSAALLAWNKAIRNKNNK